MRVVLVFVMLGRLLLSFDQGLQHPPPCPPHLSHLALDVLDLGVNLPDLHFAGAIQLDNLRSDRLRLRRDAHRWRPRGRMRQLGQRHSQRQLSAGLLLERQGRLHDLAVLHTTT